MVKSIKGEYFLMEELYFNEAVTAYTARTLLGDSVIVAEYRGISVEECSQLASVRRGKAVLGLASFISDDGHIYAISEPYSGLLLREHMKTAAALTVAEVARLIKPLVDDVLLLYGQGVAVLSINADNVIVHKGQLKLLNMGIMQGGEGQMLRACGEIAAIMFLLATGKEYSAENLPLLTDANFAELISAALGGGITLSILSTRLQSYIDPGIALQGTPYPAPPTSYSAAPPMGTGYNQNYTPPQYPYPPSYTPAPPVNTGYSQNYTPPQYPYPPNYTPATPVRRNGGGKALAILGILVMLAAFIGVAYSLNDNGSSSASNYGSSYGNSYGNGYSGSYATEDDEVIPEFENGSYYGASEIGFDTYAYLNTYVNYYNDPFFLDGMVAEHNGKVYYRVYENDHWRLYSENSDRSDKMLLAEGVAPAFMAVNDDYIFFTDCLDNYELKSLDLNNGILDVVISSPSIFNTFNEGGSMLYTTSQISAGMLLQWDVSGGGYSAITNFYAAETTVYDGRVYYNDASYDSELYSMDESGGDVRMEITSTACGYTIYDGKVYYLNEMCWEGYPNIYSYDLASGATELLVDNVVYGFTVYNDKIYYINYDDSYKIYSCDLDGSNDILLLDCNASYIKVVAGSIYYVDFDEGEALCRCDLDGSNVEILEGSYATTN